jgi:hypothetical protein
MVDHSSEHAGSEQGLRRRLPHLLTPRVTGLLQIVAEVTFDTLRRHRRASPVPAYG